MSRVFSSKRVSTIIDGSLKVPTLACGHNCCQKVRHYAAKRGVYRAPETRRYEVKLESRSIRADELERRRSDEEWHKTTGVAQRKEWVEKAIERDPKHFIVLCENAAVTWPNLTHVAHFLLFFEKRFREVFLDQGRRLYDFETFYKEDFKRLRLAYNVELEQLYEAGRHLISGNVRTFHQQAVALLHCCARDYHVDATIFMVQRNLRIDRWEAKEAGLRGGRPRRGQLHNNEGQELLLQLNAMAKAGNHRAMSLLGLVALHDGKGEKALRHFQDALPGAVELAKRTVDSKATPFLYSQQHDELSSPWIELASLAWSMNKDLSKEAFRVGEELDDPNTLYLKAYIGRQALARDHNLDINVTPYSLDWLHDMSKAASSGHVVAAMEMAQYYADSPAHPAPPESKHTMNPFKLAIQLWEAFQDIPSEVDPRQNMEHYASLVQTPHERIKMATYWLRICAQYGYAPALKSLAQIHLSKYIYPAVNLAMELVHPDKQTNTDHKTEEQFREMADGVENPYYSPRAAHDCLGLIIEVARAVKTARAEGDNKQKYNQILGLWSTFPEVVQEFEAEIPQLEQDARDIADTCGIDIQDGRGSIVYRHAGERGKGVFEHQRRVLGFPTGLLPAYPPQVTRQWRDFADSGGEKSYHKEW